MVRPTVLHTPNTFIIAAVLASWCLTIAIFPSTAAAEIKPPTLWNTKETKSTDLKKFKKWRRALKGFEKEKSLLTKPCPPDDPNAVCGLFHWNNLIQKLKGKNRRQQLDAINTYVNRSRYVVDPQNWNVRDYWETPGEFYRKQGDCEDYAIVKYLSLRALGFKPEEMRIAVIRDLNLKRGHAVLLVYKGKEILLLDNQLKIVIDANRVRHYRIFYSLNEEAWWRHSR